MGQATSARSFHRCLLVLLAATCAAVTVLSLLLPDLLTLAATAHADLDAAAFDLVLVRVAELALAACALWLWSATVVTTADAVRGRSTNRRGVPDGLRRAVLVACGLALAGGLATPAHADEPRSGHNSGRHLIEGLPLPDRATTSMHVSRLFARAAALQRARSSTLVPEVVVRAGDTLWEIARRDLPREASVQAVAERVGDVHAANRAVIGDDPDLIRPGQRLRMPRT